jgi:guanylate kinase
MKIILCGGSGSGKTTFKNKLVELGYKSITQHTNRPKRDFDTDDYIFTDRDFFTKNMFVELQYFD